MKVLQDFDIDAIEQAINLAGSIVVSKVPSNTKLGWKFVINLVFHLDTMDSVNRLKQAIGDKGACEENGKGVILTCDSDYTRQVISKLDLVIRKRDVENEIVTYTVTSGALVSSN